jgi:hypothetical protein
MSTLFWLGKDGEEQLPPWWDDFWSMWETTLLRIISPGLAAMIVRNEKFLAEIRWRGLP